MGGEPHLLHPIPQGSSAAGSLLLSTLWPSGPWPPGRQAGSPRGLTAPRCGMPLSVEGRVASKRSIVRLLIPPMRHA